MSGASIVIIGGGGNRTSCVVGTPYPVSAGDAIENGSTSASAIVAFTDVNMVTDDIYLGPGAKHTFPAAGAIVVQP